MPRRRLKALDTCGMPPCMGDTEARSRIELAHIDGRPCVVRAGRYADLSDWQAGRHARDPWALFADVASLVNAADELLAADAPVFDPRRAGPCVPLPRQIFAIGLNYRDHAAEAQLPPPAEPMVFTKFQSALAGAYTDVSLTSDRVDWEVELVVVVGRGGRDIRAGSALEHVAGFCVGQDISDRRRQFADKPPQFSLGKSARGYAPIGPTVVPLAGIGEPLDLSITCAINGQPRQASRTSEMIFSVPDLIAYLSRYCELYPGDLLFTGTPAGVGSTGNPREYLKAGDRIDSAIGQVGEMSQRCR